MVSCSGSIHTKFCMIYSSGKGGSILEKQIRSPWAPAGIGKGGPLPPPGILGGPRFSRVWGDFLKLPIVFCTTMKYFK